MSEFIEFNEYKGGKALVNIEHIVKVRPADDGTSYLYFDAATGSQGSTSLAVLHVAESYSVVKRKLQ